jgi:hypothetical protein
MVPEVSGFDLERFRAYLRLLARLHLDRRLQGKLETAGGSSRLRTTGPRESGTQSRAGSWPSCGVMTPRLTARCSARMAGWY